MSLGCGEVLKEGDYNHRLIVNKLAAAGFRGCGEENNIYVTLQTVDQAANVKTAAQLQEQGLLFSIRCDLHCVSLVVDQSRCAWNGKPTKGKDHPEQVLFDIIHLIRVHVGVRVFFKLFADSVNVILEGKGAPGHLGVTCEDVRSAIELADKAPGNRWEAKEKVAYWLLREHPILWVGEEYDDYREFLPGTTLDILTHGLDVVFMDLYHGWYNQKSVDPIYGCVPLVIKLRTLLRDPDMMAQVRVCVGARVCVWQKVCFTASVSLR